MSTYRDILEQNCTGIAKIVLDGMRLHKVGVEGDIPIPHIPILYRWWFPEDSEVLQVIRDFSLNDPELAGLLEKVDERLIDRKSYYALYFGKSNDGNRRFKNHISGNVHHSTLRLTLYGLCIDRHYDKVKEEQVSQILRECYFEWVPFTEEAVLVECLEGICIAVGNYPLNIDGNPSISCTWRRHLLDVRNISET